MAQSLLRHGFMHDTGRFQWDRALSAEALRHPEVHHIIHWCKFYPTYSRPLHRVKIYPKGNCTVTKVIFDRSPYSYFLFWDTRSGNTALEFPSGVRRDPMICATLSRPRVREGRA